MMDDLRALADQIRALGIGGRQVLAMELERQEPSAPPRCPAKDLDTAARCVRNEDHCAPHVAANGAEWLIALRCRIGVVKIDGVPICSRIDGHDGDCVPLPQAVHIAPLPARKIRLGKRGVCGCGKARQEHEGATHTGGVAGTGCTRYRP